MQADEGGPVTDADFIAVPILGNIPHGDLDQVGPEDMLGYEYVHKRELGRGRFFLRTRGDAMAPLILDGDLLLIEARTPVEAQNHRCRLHGQARNMQTTPPLQPHRGTRISQSKLRPNHRHRGAGNHRASDKNRAELSDWLAAVRRVIRRCCGMRKVKNMKGRMLGLLVVLSFAGVTLVDVAIFGPGSLTSKLVRYLQTQTDENQLPLSDVGNEAETGIKQLSPINEANKEPETQSPPQQTDANETRKLEFSMLIGILKDLTSSSAKLEFIRDNMDLMPDSLSLVELHRILALFSSVAKS